MNILCLNEACLEKQVLLMLDNPNPNYVLVIPKSLSNFMLRLIDKHEDQNKKIERIYWKVQGKGSSKKGQILHEN